MERQHDQLFKVLLVGEAGTGKSMMLSKFVDNSFSQSYLPNIAADIKFGKIHLPYIKIKLQIWDTAGQERYRNIMPLYYKGAHGIILFYDITNRQSFLKLGNWLSQIGEKAQQHISIFLVAMKTDAETDRKVTTQEGMDFAEKHGIKFLQASAKNGTNVKETFETFANVINSQLNRKDSNRLKVNPQKIECKLVFIGNSGAGKTSLIQKSCSNLQCDSTVLKPTFPAEKAMKLINYHKQTIKLDIWDISGQLNFEPIIQKYYKNALAAVFVYDITNRKSFQNISRWIKSFDSLNPNAAIKFLVGTKLDLQNQRDVITEEGMKFAQNNQMNFIETSAMSGHNIEQIFSTIVNQFMQKHYGNQQQQNSTNQIYHLGLNSLKINQKQEEQKGLEHKLQHQVQQFQREQKQYKEMTREPLGKLEKPQTQKKEKEQVDEKQDFYSILSKNGIYDTTVQILKSKNIRSLQELNKLKDKDLKSLGLKLGEIIRLRKSN